MLVQKPEKRWETRPLDCWNKAKELRQQFYQKEQNAKEQHTFVIGGGDSLGMGMMAGMPVCHFIHPNPLAAEMNNKSDSFPRECRAAFEAKGYGHDWCGYMASYLGSMMLNRSFRGGEFPRRDISVTGNDLCNFFFKHGQLESEYWDIPMHHEDSMVYYGEQDPERDKVLIEALVAQNLDLIEFLEKATGKKFDDEAYVESFTRGRRTGVLKAEVIETLQNIPAPLDEKSGYSLFTLGGLVGSDPEQTEKLWEMIRDEMRWRVENKIAAVATERYRFKDGFPPPWYCLNYYRYMEEYGAVCVSVNYGGTGGLEEQPDGSYKLPKNPVERFENIKTREDAVRAQLSGWRNFMAGGLPNPEGNSERLLKWIKAFKCNGVILQLQRNGIGCVDKEREETIRMVEEGIPVMNYETSHAGSRTDFDENRMFDQLDAFMESQGLRKLVD
jgi:benzoyl-CoA reductase subunit B